MNIKRGNKETMDQSFREELKRCRVQAEGLALKDGEKGEASESTECPTFTVYCSGSVSPWLQLMFSISRWSYTNWFPLAQCQLKGLLFDLGTNYDVYNIVFQGRIILHSGILE